MKLLEEYTKENLIERGIKYLTRTNGSMVYWDEQIIYFFNPIGIRKEEGSPFFDSNNCEKYKLIKRFKLEEQNEKRRTIK